MTLSELLMGGPGHDGYTYNADVYCVSCGQDIIRKCWPHIKGDEDAQGDSESCPQPIFFGESDHSECCADCGEHLYGADEQSEPEGPSEGDWTTTDHRTFTEVGTGKIMVDAPEDYEWNDVKGLLAQRMRADSYYPSVWYVSDHGNAHLIEL